MSDLADDRVYQHLERARRGLVQAQSALWDADSAGVAASERMLDDLAAIYAATERLRGRMERWLERYERLHHVEVE